MTTVPASRQNIEQRTPSGVRPVNSPVVPVKSNVVGAMKHGGELKKMNRSVKRMAVGGPSGGMDMGKRMAPQRGQGNAGAPAGRPLPQQPGGIGAGGKGAPAPGQNMGGQGKGPIPGKGQVPGGFMGGGAGPGMGGPKGPIMRYPMGGMGGMGGPGFDAANRPGYGKPYDQGGFDDTPAYANFMRQRLAANPQLGPTLGPTLRPAGMKKGGKVSASSYNDMTGGAAGGIGRLEKSSIAAKTKSQKLKKGGKVRGYAEGKRVVADDDKAFGSAFADARRAKADEFMWRGKYYNTKLADGKAPYKSAELPAPKKAAEKYSNAPAKTYGSSERGNGPGEYKSYGDSERGNGSGLPKTYGIPERGNSSGPAPRDFKAEGRRDMLDRLALIKPGEKMDPNRGIAGAMKYMAKQFPDERAKAEQRADMVRRLSMYPDEKKKGGKVEAFEGTARDMAEDKKLAKKYGMTKKAYEKSEVDAKHDKQRSMKGLKMGGKAKMAMGGYASGGMSTAQDGMKGALRPKPSAMAKGGKAEMHDKGCKCMACGGMAKKMAKGGKVGMTFGKPLPGTKVSSQKIRATTATGASMKKDGMKGQLRAKASGAKTTAMMKPMGMTKMAKGGKVRGAGIAQRGTKFIGEV